jgi:hypothetical protein
MAFSGNIQDLGLIDVLQLIGQSGKTGIMHVISDEIEAQIFLKDGKLVDVKSESSDLGIKIGNYLLHKEIITEDELGVLLEKQNKLPVRFGTLLVEEGIIDKKQLKKIMGEFLKERFLRVLSVDSGSYDFEQTIIEYNADEVAPIELNSILLDILKDLDEIKLFKNKIKGFEVVYAKKDDDVDVAIDDRVDNEEPVVIEGNTIKLNKDSYIVYSHIDGKNTVNDIINQTALSGHFILKVIFILYNSKKIEIAGSSTDAGLGKQKKEIDKKKLLNVSVYAGLLILICLYAFSFIQIKNFIFAGEYFKDYKLVHKEKNRLFENNLKEIYKIEYPKTKVDIDKLNINHRKIYKYIGG